MRTFEDLPRGTWCKLGPSKKELQWQKDWQWLKKGLEADGITYAKSSKMPMKAMAAAMKKATKVAFKRGLGLGRAAMKAKRKVRYV